MATNLEDRPIAEFKPAPRVKQRLRWREHWLQFDVTPSNTTFEGSSYGGGVTVTYAFLFIYFLHHRCY